MGVSDEDIEKEKRSIDYAGAVWIVVAVCSLMFILVEGGVGIAWNSPLMYGLMCTTLIGFGLFFYQEKRAAVPMMPFTIWRYRMISVANMASLTTGMILIGVSSYLPAFVQGVMGYSATIAGFTLTTMSIGWPLAAIVAGRLLLIIGYRNTSLLGSVSLIIGGVLFFLLSPDKGPVWAGIGSFFIGIGMGMTTTSFIVGIQSTVGWETRGIATATNMFMRSLGSALGAALLGGLLNSRIKTYLENKGLGDSVSVDSANKLLDPNLSVSLSHEMRSTLQDGLTSGLHVVYMGLLILAVVTFILISFMPKKENE